MEQVKDKAAQAAPGNGTQSTNNAIETVRTFGAITVDKVEKSEWQKEGTVTAQLRQLVKTVANYPTKQIENNMQDNIFSMEDFGFSTTPYSNDEMRVAFMDVPEGTTAEAVLAQLSKFPEGRLYKVMSNHPILTDAQEYAVKNELRTMDEFANSQVVRYPEGFKLDDGTEVGGQLILDRNNKVQYRRVFFAKTAKEDQDLRTKEAAGEKVNMYVSEDIAAELLGAASASTEQKIN